MKLKATQGRTKYTQESVISYRVSLLSQTPGYLYQAETLDFISIIEKNLTHRVK